jgi:uncharacterized protein (TIGR01777 family)
VRVGVTGSSGFIGSALVAALRARGDEVVCFVRPGSKVTSESVIRWNPAVGDVDDGDLQRVGGFDAVVNLAGAGIADRRWSAERKSVILDSRIEATSLLVTALRAMPHGTPYLASGSAIGVYGAHGNGPLDEGTSVGDDFLANVCASWEAAARPLADQGAAVALLRTGIVMSRRGGALKKQLPLFQFGLGGPLSTGRQWTSLISLNDEVRAILWAIDHSLDGPLNLASPRCGTNADFTLALASALHRPGRLRTPSFVLRLALGEELVDTALLASQRVVPRALVESGFEFEQPDLESIVRWAIHDGALLKR